MFYKVAIIACYYGPFPNYFQLFLKSCQMNKDFQWIIFGNHSESDLPYQIPDNVKIVFFSLDDMRELIKTKIGSFCLLHTPYKLCDYKPMYGIIFEEYLKTYTHWGHCDLDLVFGNLKTFINEELMEKYDKILPGGHLSIYKNNAKVNKRYIMNYKGITYKTVLEKKAHFGFDESKGINKIYTDNNIDFFNKCIYADINMYHWDMQVNTKANYKNQKFIWNNGHIYQIVNKGMMTEGNIVQEYAYLHMQKRKMYMEQTCTDSSEYQIYNDGFYTTIPYYAKKDKIIKKIKFFLISHKKSIMIKIKWNFSWFPYKRLYK